MEIPLESPSDSPGSAVQPPAPRNYHAMQPPGAACRLPHGDPLPLVPVGDFQLEDTIFPGMPGDSLLYNSEDLAKLCRLRFQVTTHRMEQTATIECKEESHNLPAAQGRCPAQPARMAPSLWALEHGSLFGGLSWQASMNVLVAEVTSPELNPHTVTVLGPLLAVAVECHPPTQAEHDW